MTEFTTVNTAVAQPIPIARARIASPAIDFALAHERQLRIRKLNIDSMIRLPACPPARGCHDAGIAQFCLHSAVGSTARSRFRYVRIMGMKEDTVRKIGFTRLAIFRPGIIAAAEIALPSREAGEVIRENAAMKKLAREV